MAIVVSIAGKSGTGKTRSFKDVAGSKDCIIFRTSKKPFSFRKKLKEWDKDKKEGDYVYTNDYEYITKAIQVMAEKYNKKIIIIDDSTFFMTQYFMDTALETGFTKFTANALGYYNLIKAAESLPEDVVVYLVNHIEENDMGLTKIKTIGKMLDDKVDIPSLLTIVLEARVNNKEYKFLTNKESSRDLAKSPEGMFDELYIDNDLMKIDKQIREYYFLDEVEYVKE